MALRPKRQVAFDLDANHGISMDVAVAVPCPGFARLARDLRPVRRVMRPVPRAAAPNSMAGTFVSGNGKLPFGHIDNNSNGFAAIPFRDPHLE